MGDGWASGLPVLGGERDLGRRAGADVEPVHAQSLPANIPTPAQAQDLVQNRPELVAQLRQRIQASGLSADQLRARLRAAGYPESLLEQVMGGATVGAVAPPSDSLINAVRALGIVEAALCLLALQGRGLAGSAHLRGIAYLHPVCRGFAAAQGDATIREKAAACFACWAARLNVSWLMAPLSSRPCSCRW